MHKLADALRRRRISLQAVILRIFEKRPSGTNFLLICDQFEELYTHCGDAALQRAFIDTLLDSVGKSMEEKSPCPAYTDPTSRLFGESFRLPAFHGCLATGNFRLGPMGENSGQRLKSQLKFRAHALKMDWLSAF